MNNSDLKALIQLIGRLEAATDRGRAYHHLAEALSQFVGADEVAIWGGRGRLLALASGAKLDAQSPYVQSLAKLYHLIESSLKRGGLEADKVEPLGLPSNACFVAFDEADVVVALLRVTPPFRPSELSFLQFVTAGVENSLRNKREQARPARVGRLLAARSIWGTMALLGCALVLVSFIHVPASAVYNAELRSGSALSVRAPVNGTISEFLVSDGEAVTEGDILYKIDDVAVASQLQIAQSEMYGLQSRYEQASLRQATSRDNAEELQRLGSLMDEKMQQIDFLETQLERHEVRAPISGVVEVVAEDRLSGLPVQIGQGVLNILDASDLIIEARMPATRALNVEVGDPLRFYPYSSPWDGVDARLTQVATAFRYDEQGASYIRLRARALEDDLVALAAKGLGEPGRARVYADRVRLIFVVFRAPIAWLRQFLSV